MSQESYSDFSIIKKYIEIRSKYDVEVQNFKEKISGIEANFQQNLGTLRKELEIKTDQIKVLERQLQELTNKIKEKDEMLKNLGLQLHKIKGELETPQTQNAMEGEKKSKFGIFK